MHSHIATEVVMRCTCNCHTTNAHTMGLTIFGHLFIIVTSIGEPPLIMKVDTDGAKRRYQPEEKVSFYCEATGVKLKYTWLQDEKELREQHQQTLTIKKAKQDTGGAYQCCVSNPFGEVKSEIIKITVGE